ncbi:MAG TPA: hypothetical protein VI643_03215 [Planctomycetota bacterium]|nr:hypothetical protein [Planctomycetota bacterium]
MPPYLAIPYFHLSKLPLTTKLALTGFYVSILSAVAFVGIAYFPKVLEPEREASKNFLKKDVGLVENVHKHFDPTQIDRETMERAGATPKEIEDQIADQRKGQQRKAYDIIHPHSFLMPVVYFILCHLMEMTTLARAARIGLYSASFVGMMLVVFAPLTVPAMAWLAAPTILGLYVMLACFATMAMAPMIHMWVVKPKP